MFQRFVDAVLEFLGTATVAKTIIVCVTFLTAVLMFQVWAERTGETIKLWPPEISAPESEEMKACHTLQAAVHDEIQTLENDRTSAYKAIENDKNNLNEATRLRIDAMERDKRVQKETGSRENDNEEAVINRVKQLESDWEFRDRTISWIRQTINDRSDAVYSLCVSIIQARR